MVGERMRMVADAAGAGIEELAETCDVGGHLATSQPRSTPRWCPMLLVPAIMHGVGRANWWAPKRLARPHDRFGLREGTGGGSGIPSRAAQSAPEGETADAQWRVLTRRLQFGVSRPM